MRNGFLIIPLAFGIACTPAHIKRELVERSNAMHPQPVDAIAQIGSQTHGGIGVSAPLPVDVPSNLPIPSRGFTVPTLHTGLVGLVYTIIESNIAQACAVPGANGAASANCLARYDGVLIAPRQKAPIVNTERH